MHVTGLFYLCCRRYPDLEKIGSGSYAQVFGSKRAGVAFKFIPVCDAEIPTHDMVMSLQTVLNDVVATYELGTIAKRGRTLYSTPYFARLKRIRLLRGRVSHLVRQALAAYNRARRCKKEIYCKL